MLPKSVEVAQPQKGDSFKEAIAQPINQPLEGLWRIVLVVADFKTARARYVRVTIKNYGTVPVDNQNEQSSRPASLAVDEIVRE